MNNSLISRKIWTAQYQNVTAFRPISEVAYSWSSTIHAVRLGPDLQNILRQSCDYLTIVPKLRSTYDGRLIYKTAYNEWKAFQR